MFAKSGDRSSGARRWITPDKIEIILAESNSRIYLRLISFIFNSTLFAGQNNQ